MRIKSLTVLILLMCTVYLPAQYEEAGQYVRKSILYLNSIVVLHDSGKKLSTFQIEEIHETIADELQLGRFDYMTLPESLSDVMNERMSAEEIESPDSLAKKFENLLLPTVRNIFEQTIDVRSRELLTEAQKNSKLAIKAKEFGLTLPQLRALLNSAYFYIPYVKSAHRIASDDDITWSLSLGLIWYRVVITENRIQLERVVESGMALGYGKKKESYLGFSSADDFAFNAALKAAVHDLKLKIMALPAFRLTAQIIQKSGWSAAIDIGKREGIRPDDKFYVIEETELPGGKIKRRKTGYGYITSVAHIEKNPEAVSTLHLISGIGSTEPGMTLQEHPRTGIDFSLKYVNLLFNSKKNKSTAENLDSLNMHGIEGTLLLNFGRYVGWNQTWLELSGVAAGSKVNLRGDSGGLFPERFTGTVWEFKTGILKKYYFSRLAFSFSGGFMFRHFQLDAADESYTPTYYQDVAGLYGRGAIEFSLGIDFNLLAYVGYSGLGESDLWTSDDGSAAPAWQVDHNTLQFGAGFVWSLPVLPFDPWSLFRAVSGL